jgi:hypothetical protein
MPFASNQSTVFVMMNMPLCGGVSKLAILIEAALRPGVAGHAVLQF